jgi:hypothetical protein
MLRNVRLAVVTSIIAIGVAGCSTSPSPAPLKTDATTSATPAASPFISVAYPPLPAGWQDGRAALTATVGDVQYIVQELVEADQQMLWFMKSTGRDAQGQFTWVVTDVLNRSDMKESGGLIWGFCTFNDEPDEEIVALGERKEGVMENVQRAWRANHLTGRFELITTTGIVCQDEPIGP